jgi:hypothetical protein
MASFQTHLNGGIFVSGGSVLSLQGLGLVPEGQTLALFALGVLGSVLPDIDAEASAPVRGLFGALGVAMAFAWTLPLVGAVPPLELALVWFSLFLAVRFLLFRAFSRFTVHRGIWHSWLATALVTLATVNLAYWLLHQPPPAAWIAGFMVGLGYLTHLCLDELSSVDIFNSRVRRSFGTALKPLSLSDPLSSLAMASAVGVLAWFAPSAELPLIPGGADVAAWADEAVTRLDAWSDAGAAAIRDRLQ